MSQTKEQAIQSEGSFDSNSKAVQSKNPTQEQALHALPVPPFSQAAIEVLRKGRIIDEYESPDDMVERVVHTILNVETWFGTDSRVISSLKYEFADYMARKLVTLGSPTLSNAGRHNDMALSSCIAIPVDLRRSFEAIRPLIEAYYEQNMGSGFDLSEVEDPAAVVEILNRHAALETVRGKYDRYIGNMANLDVDHPKARNFALMKATRSGIRHFNLSLNVSDASMDAFSSRKPLVLKDGSITGSYGLWSDIVQSAWKCGDPGLLFMDRFNAENPTPTVGAYVTTAPCAEVGLSPGESCIFGYVNLGNFLRKAASGRQEFDYDLLHGVVTLLTRVLDNALEASLPKYPSPKSRTVMHAKRKIGIGICGFADLLIRLRLPYGSPEARDLLQNILISISFYSKWASMELARQRGSFPAFPVSRYMTEKHFLSGKYIALEGLRISPSDWQQLEGHIKKSGRLRHASTTALPPSGRSALILDASTSLEPWFSLFDNHGRLKPELSTYVAGQYPEPDEAARILSEIVRYGTCQLPGVVHNSISQVVKSATEIAPRDHLAVVAAATRCVDEAASKTINLPRDASPDIVADIFFQAWKLGLKAISVYRDGSTEAQPEDFRKAERNP
jgi:ribonucleoside-diphosphate reductase alpha chain